MILIDAYSGFKEEKWEKYWRLIVITEQHRTTNPPPMSTTQPAPMSAKVMSENPMTDTAGAGGAVVIVTVIGMDETLLVGVWLRI